MKTILMFHIGLEEKEHIELPVGAKVLNFQILDRLPTIWVEVDSDPAIPREERMFEVFETGEIIHEGMGVERRYIGTIELPVVRRVLHLYERLS